MTRADIPALADQLEGKSPEDILRWASATFGEKLAVGTALGAEDMVLMDMVSRAGLSPTFIFLDTDFHFQDTLDLLETARRRYGVSLVIATSEITPDEQASRHGPALYFRDPSKCCEIRKIEPMRRALAGYSAWVTGMRKDQTGVRAYLRNAEWDGKFGLAKISPLLTWPHDEVWAYIRKHDVPYNRLHDMGFPSIGCAPCTRSVKPGEDPRAGRWAGFDKTECGLHTQ